MDKAQVQMLIDAKTDPLEQRVGSVEGYQTELLKTILQLQKDVSDTKTMVENFIAVWNGLGTGWKVMAKILSALVLIAGGLYAIRNITNLFK